MLVRLCESTLMDRIGSGAAALSARIKPYLLALKTWRGIGLVSIQFNGRIPPIPLLQ